MKGVNPYLNFNGTTEEAFEFYRSIFGGEFLGVLRFRDFEDNSAGVPEEELDKIAHIALPVGKNLLMGTDVLKSQESRFFVGSNVYFNVEAEDGAEAERLFNGLAAGGTIEMPLQETEWAEKYGICADRYGVQWMVDYTGHKSFNMPPGDEK